MCIHSYKYSDWDNNYAFKVIPVQKDQPSPNKRLHAASSSADNLQKVM